MGEMLDIRWRQRFQNFQNALGRLSEAEAIIGAVIGAPINNAELQLLKEGLLQRFEFTQELVWKVMKDYMEYQGINGLMGSRDTFRNALKLGLISDQRWINSITDRNITSHAYDETEAGIIYDNVRVVYLLLFKEFETKMMEILNGEG